MKTIKGFIIASLFWVITSGFVSPRYDNCNILLCFVDGKVYKEKVHIPKKLLKLYWKKYEYKLVIADPNEDWNKTDLLSKKDKNSQLIFGGSYDQSGFVFLNKGGIGLSKKCIIYNLETDYLEVIGVNPNVSTEKEVKQIIKTYLSCND
ncbi:MAG: hypothetical protein AAFX87_30230 [Bacteroidota bacterium]